MIIVRIGIFATILVTIIISTEVTEASELARRLGYKDSDKVLLLHADDMGLSPLTNKAVDDVIRFGMVKSASIMIPAPYARAAIQEYGYLDLGVHLTFNSEWDGYRWTPVSDPDDVPSIVSMFSLHNYLYKDRGPVYFFGRTRDVVKELRAQLNQALAFGLKPTHMDSHMAMVLLKKDWAKGYLRSAKKYRIPPMIVRWSKDLHRQLPPLIMNHLKKLSAQAQAAGFLAFDYASLGIPGQSYMERKEAFVKYFMNLKPGVTMVFMHPSYFNATNPFPSDVVEQRTVDALVMQDPEVKHVLEDLDIKLIGWRDIQQAYNWDAVNYPEY